MTSTAFRAGHEPRRILAIAHPASRPDPGRAARRRPVRGEAASARPAIDELIWQAIADQPPQLYRGGA